MDSLLRAEARRPRLAVKLDKEGEDINRKRLGLEIYEDDFLSLPTNSVTFPLPEYWETCALKHMGKDLGAV